MTGYLLLALAAGLGTWLATRAWRRNRAESLEDKVNRVHRDRRVEKPRPSGDPEYPSASSLGGFGF